MVASLVATWWVDFWIELMGTFALMSRGWISRLQKITRPSNLHTTYLLRYSRRWASQNCFYKLQNTGFFGKNINLISLIPCHKDAPLQLTHNLDNHLQLSLMDTNQSSEETPRRLQHKSPTPHCGRPLVWLRHKRLILTRTGQLPG